MPNTSRVPNAPSIVFPRVPPWVAVSIACMSSFMVVMDGAIVNVALPAIQADLHMSLAQLQWVVDAYLLTLGGFMLLASRAGDLFGRRRVLQWGLLTFTLSSLVGGFADSASVLLSARAFQGFGASALATSTLALIVAVHPQGPARGKAISWWVASSSIASALGVTLGGVLTSQLNWRWVMFVNVPIGVMLMLAVGVCLAPMPANAARQRLDLPGAVCATLGIGGLMYGMSLSVSLGWTSVLVWKVLGSALVLIALFLLIQTMTQQPLIRLSVFRIHNVRLGNLVVLATGAVMTTSTLFSSLYLQQVSDYQVLEAGLALLPFALTLAVTALVSRVLMERGVSRLPFWGGLTAAVAMLWMSRVPVHAQFVADILGPMLFLGLGLGLMLMTVTHTAIAGVPAKEAGLASGLLNTARQLGGALGVAALMTVAHHMAPGKQPTAELMHLHAYQVVFTCCAGLSALAGWMSLFLHRPTVANRE